MSDDFEYIVEPNEPRFTSRTQTRARLARMVVALTLLLRAGGHYFAYLILDTSRSIATARSG
jgi:hypothetical protein